LQPDGVLPNHEVHVWHAALVVPEQGIDSLLDLLDAQERDRASRFKLHAPRYQFILSHAFLRSALGLYLDIPARNLRFVTGGNGKPALADGHELKFNLSHSGGAAVLAIARNRELGVDIERIREDVNALDLAQRFFSAPEVEWLKSQPASTLRSAFFSCWTAKEAYVKACGEGLSLPLSGFGVVSPSTGNDLKLQIYGDATESRRWSVRPLDLGPDFRAALAVEGENWQLQVGQWPVSLRE